MKTRLFYIILSIFGIFYGQDLQKHSVSTGGGSADNGNVYMAYALGELGVQETQAGNVYLSEGFIGPDLYAIMGVEDYAMLNGVRIYPNPVINDLKINLSDRGNYQVEIFDLNGKKLWSKNFESVEKIKVDISKIPAGLYILGIKDHENHKMAALKFVKR